MITAADIAMSDKLNTKSDPWKHRSEGMQCRTCMWFVEKAGRIGRCRRHSPTMSGYPVVFLTDWCGDHKLDEGDADAPMLVRPGDPIALKP